MKTTTPIRILNCLLLLLAPAGWAQSSASDDPLARLDPPAAASPNRFGLSSRLGFNTSVSFRNLGGYTLPATRFTPSGDPYNYNNGYVYPDPNGVANPAWPTTWYWGYDAAPGQYTLGDPSVIMQRSSAGAYVSSPEVNDDPMPGFEATYDRELYHNSFMRCGPEAAFGYSHLSVNDSTVLREDVTVENDAFGIPIDPTTGYGVTYFPVPGSAGAYTHGFNRIGTGGSDPLIFRGPVALPDTVLPGAATITGNRSFDADLFSLRVGPYFDFPISKKVVLGLSGGFALVYVNSHFSYTEAVSIAGLPSTFSSGAGSHSDWLPGGYVAGNISYALSDQWALTAGAQFQDVGHYTQDLDGKQASLDLSKAIFMTFGVTYSF
jgi:hypothetical protein